MKRPEVFKSKQTNHLFLIYESLYHRSLKTRTVLLGFTVISLMAHTHGLKPYQNSATRWSRKFNPLLSLTILHLHASRDPRPSQAPHHMLTSGKQIFIICKDFFLTSAALHLQESDSLLFLL